MKDLEFKKGTDIYTILKEMNCVIPKTTSIIDLDDSRFVYFDYFTRNDDYKKVRLSVGLPMTYRTNNKFTLKDMYFDLSAIDKHGSYVNVVHDWEDDYGINSINEWNNVVGRVHNIGLLIDKI